MRAISLEKVATELANFGIFPDEFSLLHGKEERDLFQRMWEEQGESFWIKFATAVRSKTLLDPDYCAEDSDPIFIDLLKKLTGKSCGSVLEYIRNTETIIQKRITNKSIDIEKFINGNHADNAANSKLANALRATFGKTHGLTVQQLRQRFRLNLRCVGTLLRLLTLWRQSIEGETVWEIPTAWALPCSIAQPYEVYLRARWGDRLPELLGIQKSQIGWWKAPPRPAPQHIPQVKIDGPNWLQTTYSWASKHPRAQPIGGEQTFYKRLFKQNGIDLKWKMLELSIAPPLAARYHRSSAQDLLNSDKHYMAVCVWTAACQEGLGTGLSFLQQSQHYDIEPFKYSGDYDAQLPAWKKKMERMMKVLKQTFENIEGAIKPHDLAQGAEEILLEPRVLLSLPSSSSLLQTWLACAVIEIQKVEYDSLELRHWPLPTELEAVTRELLSLIAYTKERVLLAMSLFVMHVTNYVDVMYDAELLSVLLEKALLPSTSGLQFICSGKAIQAVTQIKQLAYRESRNIKNCVSIPLESYNTAETLADVHYNFFWHLCYWCNPASLLEPFPAVSLMNTDIQGLVSELRRNVVPPANYPATYTVNALGHDEMSFWAEWFNKSQGGDFQDLNSQVDRRLNQIKKVMMHVSSLGYVSQDAVSKIQSNINAGTLHKLAEMEIDTHHNEKLTLPQQAVLYACMYIQLNETLRGIDLDQQKSSVLGWLVRLSGELSEREQLIRLAATIANYSTKTPVLPGLEAPEKDATPDQILQGIKAVSREPVRDLKWLWSQLPSEWQLPVKTTEQEPLMEKGLSTVVESLENRLGRLLLTSAREGLRQSDIFDQRLEMQYMMPCYISALLDIGANPSHQDQAQNLVGLLHCLLNYYETQLTAWVKGNPSHSVNRRNTMHMKGAYEIMTDEDFKFNNSVYVGQHIMELITQRMQAFIGLGQRDLEGLPGFCEVVGAMKQWPVIQSCKELNEQYTEVEVFSCFAWKHFAVPHCVTLLQQCQAAWPIEPPKDPKLAQLLYVTELMSQIEVLSCAAFHRDFLLQFQLQMGCAEFHEFVDKMNHVLLWRREFLARVVSAEMQQPGDLNVCVAKGHSLIKDMWRAIRSLRRKIKIVHPMDFPPTGHPTIEQAVSSFIRGNVKETDDVINCPEFYLAKEAKKSTPTATPSKPQRKVPCPKPGSSASKPPTIRPQADSFDPKVKWCRKCLEVQVGSNTFIKCQQCVEENYPDVNFFCTEKCKDAWMKEEHFAEHLEYELGLSPLCQTK